MDLGYFPYKIFDIGEPLRPLFFSFHMNPPSAISKTPWCLFEPSNSPLPPKGIRPDTDSNRPSLLPFMSAVGKPEGFPKPISAPYAPVTGSAVCAGATSASRSFSSGKSPSNLCTHEKLKTAFSIKNPLHLSRRLRSHLKGQIWSTESRVVDELTEL